MTDAGFLQDPYPTYRAWRESTPVHWSTAFSGGAWVVTRHADVEQVLRDPSFSARRTGGWVRAGAAERRSLHGFQRIFARAMLFLDAPDHGRLRSALHAAFRPAVLQAAPVIERAIDQLFGAVEDQKEFDFMQAVARPLPAGVIASLMGFDELPEEFVVRCEDLATFIGATNPSQEQAHRAQSSLLAIVRGMEPLLARRRIDLGDDLVSHLLRAEMSGAIEAGPELLAQCVMLLFGGYETTRNLLGNGVYALLSHPEQWQRLREQPSLVPGAVRELLRYDSPVQYTGRRVATDTHLHGQALQRGDLVLAMIGAANRDPRAYERPDALDVARQAQPPLSFGTGAHVCIGAALASLEAQAVIRRVIDCWPALSLAERPSWNGNAVYRGLTALRVRK